MTNKPKHGEERQEKIKVNHDKTEYFKRKKYCVKHDWVDLFLIGGDLAWQRQHSKCNEEVEAGAYIEPVVELKTMKKAA